MTDTKETTTTKKKTVDSVNETTDNAIDEANNLARGITMAVLEQIRLSADVVTSFVDDVFDRNSRENKSGNKDLTTRLPGDISAAYVDAVDRALKIPKKTIDKFQESYKEAEKAT